MPVGSLKASKLELIKVNIKISHGVRCPKNKSRAVRETTIPLAKSHIIMVFFLFKVSTNAPANG